MTEPQYAATVPERLRERCADRPTDAALLVVGVGALSYGDWLATAQHIARGLHARHVTRGDRVIVVCDPLRWIPYAVAYMAVLIVGGVAVPVSTNRTPSQLRDIANLSEAVGIIGGESPLPGVWAAANDTLAQTVTAPLPLRVRPSDDAEILFTSGTTAHPKGVVATHENLVYRHSPAAGSTDLSVVLTGIPPATQAGQSLMLDSLNRRPRVVVFLPSYTSVALAQAIDQYSPSHLVLTPTMAYHLLSSVDAQTIDNTSLRVVRIVSAAITPHAKAGLQTVFPQARIDETYTSTEAWPAQVTTTFDPEHPRSLGRVDPNHVRITGPDGRPVEADLRGPIELRLPSAPRRRYLDPSDEHRTFLPGGWVRMGDVGHLDAEARLYVDDRMGDSVNVGGRLVSTLAVEAAAAELPGVVQAYAVGMPHPTLGQYLALAVLPGSKFDRSAVTATLAERLGPDAPARIAIVKAFPRNDLGKVVRHELADQIAAQFDANDLGPDPADDLSLAVRAIWEEALLQDRIAWQQGFLAVGGDSLAAVEIVTRIRDDLHRHVTQRELFNSLTLREFAARVREALPATIDPGDAIPRAPRTESETDA